MPAAYHGGVGEVAWLGGLRTGDNGADDSSADCTCKLEQRVHGCVAVGVEAFRELAEAVGHNRAHGKALAEGEEEVKDDEKQRCQLAGIKAVADDGEQDGAVAEENRTLGTELIEQPAADGGEGCAEQTAGQEQAACGEGAGAADELCIVGDEKAKAEADEADKQQADGAECVGCITKDFYAQQRCVAFQREAVEQRQRGKAEEEERQHLAMQPAERGGQRGGKDEAAEADDEQKIQRQVEAYFRLQCTCLTDAFDAQRCGKQQEGHQADENHTPAKIADNQAAERRADRRRHGGDERGYANHEAEAFAGHLL